MKDFAAIVMRDEGLAENLAAIDNSDVFVDEAVRCARARDIALSAASLHDARQPDLLGLSRWSAPKFAGTALPSRGWLPVAAGVERNAVVIDWARFGPRPLHESFYEDSIRRVLALPFNRAFRYRTTLADLIAGIETTESLAPDGFIFHMSRCGSTLVAQMLAALPDSIVISEAAPIDAIVQLARSLPADTARAALRAMIAAFGRKRGGGECRYFIKLDFWHPLALPLFREAFPDVPWIFLYRDPVEVLVSQMRQRGMQMVPQFVPPSVYGIDAADCAMDEDYCARVLAAVCRAAIGHRGLGGGLFINYQRLPDAVFTAILPHFGMSCSEAEAARMLEAASHDAKAPYMAFAADGKAKQHAATDAIRHAADHHLRSVYDLLETLSERNGTPALARPRA